MLIEIAGEVLKIGIEKYIYFEKYNVLVISDLHFGKLEHFRKHGIAVPSGLDREDHYKLSILFKTFQPDVCIFLGDLFHSEYNEAWDIFTSTLQQFSEIKFILTEGNHDILQKEEYTKVSIEIVDQFQIGSIVLSHEPMELSANLYNIHGHIHPGVALKGKGRQHLRLPCFYFGKSKGIMPAFGKFTGLYSIAKGPEDRIIAITNTSLIEV